MEVVSLSLSGLVETVDVSCRYFDATTRFADSQEELKFLSSKHTHAGMA